jgi:pyrimidine operon attenuation protein/uracil phosphoribosyltransferase
MTRSASEKSLGMTIEHQLLDAEGVRSALDRMAEQISNTYTQKQAPILIGIRTGGVFLAERLKFLLQQKKNWRCETGIMDITLYRDDPFSGLPKPEVGSTELPVSLENRLVILVDDVLFTGRTIRAALMELMDFGRPDRVELAVLVDRGHRELPIQPNYVGFTAPTERHHSVLVFLTEQESADQVVLFRKKAGQT